MGRLRAILGWGQAARPSLSALAPEASPPKVLLRAERAAKASLRWRVRLDRAAPHRLDIVLTLFVLAQVFREGAALREEQKMTI